RKCPGAAHLTGSIGPHLEVMKKGHAATSRWEASRPPHRFDFLPAIQVAPQCTQGHIPEFLQLSQGFATALSNCESLNAEDDCNQRLPKGTGSLLFSVLRPDFAKS